MTKPGDVVEFRSGLHGIEAPRNLGVLVDRRRVKGVPWVRIVTLDGEKEVKAEHLGKRVFKERYQGDLRDAAAVRRRLEHLVATHAKGGLAEEPEDDLGRLEERLWEATCDAAAGRDAWTEEELANAMYGAASPQQLRDVRAALDRCRRAGTGRFQTVGGRGDQWRPWTRSEHDAMRKAWQDLAALRKALVDELKTAEGRAFERRAVDDATLAPHQTTLAWVKAAMVQFVDWDGVPDGAEPVRGIGGLGATQAFGMDLHRQLGFLAQDFVGAAHTSHSSDYIHFLLDVGAWSAQDAVDGLVRRHVNQEEFFEHTEDARAEQAADAFPRPRLEDDPDRTDLRHLPCYTIDPADAKDFDDAVGLEDTPRGLRLWVHVADVSHYVHADTTLDRHARRRATSVYLPGRVLPMLPHRLSDDLCSLRDDGDRFALSVGLDLDAAGHVVGATFHKALIRVTENLTYATALERARAGAQPFARMLATAQAMRSHRGGIELETGELRVLLGASGFSALEKRADDATRMIETFMVAANEAVAKHLAAASVPALYRCHPLPDRDKAERLKHQLSTLRVPVAMELPGRARHAPAAQAESLLDQLRRGGGKLSLFGGGVEAPKAAAPEPEDVAKPVGFAALPLEEREAWLRPFRQAVDAIASERDDGRAEVATLKVLGAMGRAYYAPENAGHFGLALTHYCHFTSPIRRYPDLVVHRNLKWLIAGSRGAQPHDQASLLALCDHCSNQERAADGLERRIKSSCLVLAATESGAGPARVTGMTPAWLFVLRDDGIEARIPQRELPGGPYQVDAWESLLYLEAFGDPRAEVDPETGEERLVRARLADRVQVRLAGRDVAAGRTGATLVAWQT